MGKGQKRGSTSQRVTILPRVFLDDMQCWHNLYQTAYSWRVVAKYIQIREQSHLHMIYISSSIALIHPYQNSPYITLDTLSRMNFQCLVKVQIHNSELGANPRPRN